jgi:hypothetical protein
MSLSLALVACSAAVGWANEFEAPKLITSEGKPIQVEAPGYAVPCLADLDGDGVRDLLVGQFKRRGRSASSRGRCAVWWGGPPDLPPRQAEAEEAEEADPPQTPGRVVTHRGSAG